MSLNSTLKPSTIVIPSISSSSADLRPSSRGGLNNSTGIGSSSSGLLSPMTEPVAGPSGMGPVQQVPLVSFYFILLFFFVDTSVVLV